MTFLILRTQNLQNKTKEIVSVKQRNYYQSVLLTARVEYLN